MFILPVMKDHLSWETTKFRGHFIQVSLHYKISIVGADDLATYRARASATVPSLPGIISDPYTRTGSDTDHVPPDISK